MIRALARLQRNKIALRSRALCDRDPDVLRSYVCHRIDRAKGFADHPHVNFALTRLAGWQKFVGFARRFRINEPRWFSVLRLAVVDGH
jgi:hypothetical protein